MITGVSVLIFLNKIKKASFIKGCFFDKWSRLVSNQRPPPCQGDTLPTELQDQVNSENKLRRLFSEWIHVQSFRF